MAAPDHVPRRRTRRRRERKAERLRYLTARWTRRLAPHDRVTIVTDLRPGRSCGIAAFHVDGLDSAAIATRMLAEHRILVGGPSEDAWSAPPLVRITPNVFTAAAEIDAFTDAMEAQLARL